jgi:N-acetyl-anhydromuramyl-L-alanine amidase AmpD
MAYPIKDIRKTIPKHKIKKPKKRKNADTIVLHCTASDNQDPNKTASYHVTPGKDNHLCKTGAPTVAYTDIITKAGILYHCTNYTDVTWHAGNWNDRAIGIALAYKGLAGEPPTELQMFTLHEHLTFLCLYLHISPTRIFGHRECPFMSTITGKGVKIFRKECPGMSINLDKLRLEIILRLQKRLSALELYKGSIDGKWGKLSEKALLDFIPSASDKIDWVY